MPTPFCAHAIQDHHMKKRPQPQGTYAHALLRARHTRPAEEKQKDPSLNAPTLTPYYVHALQDHQKKKRAQPQGTYAHALLRTRHTNRQSVGVLARKAFEHFNEYGVKKKQLNLIAIGLDSSVG